MVNKICIIAVYFGKLPDYFDLWMLSVEYNPSVDFMLVTDQKIDKHPKNLRIITMDLAGFKKLTEEKLKMKIRLDGPYKLCDFKEVYGVILQDEIKDYDYWGECDLDVVFGDLKHFFDEYHLEKYDKFLNRGHLTLYRNTEEVNERYKLSGGAFGRYKEVFKSNLAWAFDETMGINKIYEKHGFSYMDEYVYVDVDVNYSDIRMVERPGKLCKNSDEQIFYWSDGKLFRDFVGKSGKIEINEYAYIHLQRRKLPKPSFDLTKKKLSFYITNNGFIEKTGKTTQAVIKKYNLKDKNKPEVLQNGAYKKDLRFFWLGRRWLNFKLDFIQFLVKTKRFVLSLAGKGSKNNRK